jgi:hypothetical protein
MDNPVYKKFDGRFRLQLMSPEKPKGPFELFVRIPAAPTASQQTELRSAGLTIRSISGAIVTGSAADLVILEKIATLPFVRSIEVSRALFKESP